jgi:hypothetical protein
MEIKSNFIDLTNSYLKFKISVIHQTTEEDEKENKRYEENIRLNKLKFERRKNEFSECRKQVKKRFEDDFSEEMTKDDFLCDFDDDINISEDEYKMYFKEPLLKMLRLNIDKIIDDGLESYGNLYDYDDTNPSFQDAIEWIQSYIENTNYDLLDAFCDATKQKIETQNSPYISVPN